MPFMRTHKRGASRKTRAIRPFENREAIVLAMGEVHARNIRAFNVILAIKLEGLFPRAWLKL